MFSGQWPNVQWLSHQVSSKSFSSKNFLGTTMLTSQEGPTWGHEKNYELAYFNDKWLRPGLTTWQFFSICIWNELRNDCHNITPFFESPKHCSCIIYIAVIFFNVTVFYCLLVLTFLNWKNIIYIWQKNFNFCVIAQECPSRIKGMGLN